ncbi:Uncharacterized protein APZ42_030594 [Daphnia magna]|uniref:Uncharacterized protein n=2 Tax=Daphnia magna TaxID=35525 RepID=A0A164NLM7_9CRUS|nr:hypothetical protein OUZ56_001318 [Daphnia magna]KZS06062.1 Uncharacterized protein APZ42_030594 [Daphnia magna]
MSLKVCCILLLACIVAIHAQAVDPSKKETANDARIFLSTFTVILSTVTSTTTIGSTTTCTTSTAALNTCSVGRRRRGLFYDDAENQGRARRGLFYNDDEPEVNNAPVKRAAEPAEPATKVTTDESKSVPLVVQSGFSLPEGFVTPSGTPRFKLAYGTSTITTTATSVSTRSLTATCASTTSFSLCNAAGK